MAARFRDPFAILAVGDMDRSLRFYRDLLGFAVTYAFPATGAPMFVSLDLDGGKLALGAGDAPVERPSTAIWLYVDDVDAALTELRAADVPVVAEPTDQPWGERVASVADPDGHVVHLGATAA